jgi:uncharacterized protein (DUF1697 family)
MGQVRNHVALLSGINVGGHNKVAMADLRALMTGLGHEDVATYIQSGNVVFGASGSDPFRLATDLEREITGQLGVRCKVVVLSGPELGAMAADNPYPEETDPKRLHIVFRREDAGPVDADAVRDAQQRAADKGSRDEATVLGRTIYLRLPDGMGRSELAKQLTRLGYGGSADAAVTVRNWATVGKLLALLEG